MGRECHNIPNRPAPGPGAFEIGRERERASLGFDQLTHAISTRAIDLLSEDLIGENTVGLPDAVQITAPFHRDIIPTNIRGIKDYVVSGLVGVKDTARGGLPSAFNTLIPITVGALQPRIAFTAGVEYRF